MRIKPLIYSQVGTSNGMSCGGCRYFFDGSHIPKSTQRVGGCFLKFSKSTWYFFIRKIIRYQKIFSEGQKFFGKKRGWAVFRENFEKYHSTFFKFHSSRKWEFHIKRRGWGSSGKKIVKYHGTFLFVHSQRGWVGVEFEKFRKVSICSIKKVPAK